MSEVSARLSMRHRCSIARDANAGGGDTPWGSDGPPDWQPHITDLPCRVWTNAAREPTETQKTFVVEDRRLAIPLGTDVTEADQLTSVTDVAGNVIYPGPMNITGVLTYHDHLELLVEQVR